MYFFCGISVLYMQELKENNIPLENVRICYSPFSRTIHTAKVVASVLNIPFEGAQCKVNSSNSIQNCFVWVLIVEFSFCRGFN